MVTSAQPYNTVINCLALRNHANCDIIHTISDMDKRTDGIPELQCGAREVRNMYRTVFSLSFMEAASSWQESPALSRQDSWSGEALNSSEICSLSTPTIMDRPVPLASSQMTVMWPREGPPLAPLAPLTGFIS
jgi:hypothetical protein